MLPYALRRYHIGLALVLIGLIVLGSIPSLPVAAQETGEIQYIDNSQSNFADGVFERTAVGPFRNNAIADDAEGAVQLAPAGILNPWGVGVNLPPEAVSNGGLVSLSNYLYLVAGELVSGKSDKVFRAAVDTTTGRPIDDNGVTWKEFTIPASVAADDDFGCPDSVAARTRQGTAAFEATAGPNLGYIYLVGGVVDLPGCGSDLTTPMVQIGTVGNDGEITAWRSAPFLPNALSSGALDTDFPEGIADPAVTIVRTSTNRYFLYVIGGFRINPSSFNSRITNAVIYARLNSETGALENPNTGDTAQPWARATDIEFAALSKTGIRDATAMTARASKLDTTSDPPVVVAKDAIFLAGGCYDVTNCAATNKNVSLLRADISDPNTGAITWQPRPSVGSPTEVAFEGRNGMGGIAYNSKLYLIGGSSDGTPANAKASVPTAFYDEDMNVLRLGNNDDFFIGPNEPVLPGPRTDLAVALVQATPLPGEPANAAWVYVIGGRDTNGDNTNTLTIGRVGGDAEADGSKRTRDGWYYSSVESIRIEGKTARVLTLRWTAEINRDLNTAADVRVEFRKAVTAVGTNCKESDFDPSTAATNDERWRTIPKPEGSTVYSINNTEAEPFNIVKMTDLFPNESIVATCIQFRAYLMQNGENTDLTPPDEGATPRILSFSLEKVLTGNPDLKVEQLSVITREGSLRDVQISIKNLNNLGLDETLAVDEATGNDGSFFVNLCAAQAPIGQEPQLTLPLPQANGPIPGCSIAFAEIQNSSMQPGTVLDLGTLPLWRPNPESTNTPKRTLRDLYPELFSEPGNYKIGLVIDFNNMIPEGTSGELNNRGETETALQGQIVSFTVTASPTYELSLPLLAK